MGKDSVTLEHLLMQNQSNFLAKPSLNWQWIQNDWKKLAKLCSFAILLVNMTSLMRMVIFMISVPWVINLAGLAIHGLLQFFLDSYEYPIFSCILQAINFD